MAGRQTTELFTTNTRRWYRKYSGVTEFAATSTVVALPSCKEKALARETACGDGEGLNRDPECSYRGCECGVSTAIMGDTARQSVDRHFSSVHNVVEPPSLISTG